MTFILNILASLGTLTGMRRAYCLMDYYNLVSGWYNLRLRQTEKKKKVDYWQSNQNSKCFLSMQSTKAFQSEQTIVESSNPNKPGRRPGTWHCRPASGLLAHCAGALAATAATRLLEALQFNLLHQMRNDATTCGNFIGKQVDVR